MSIGRIAASFDIYIKNAIMDKEFTEKEAQN